MQQGSVDCVPAFGSSIVGLESESEKSDSDRQQYAVAADELARPDNNTSGQRQVHVHTFEEFRESGHHLPEDERDDSACDDDNSYRVNHSRLYGAFQLYGLFDINRQPLENGVEDTA